MLPDVRPLIINWPGPYLDSCLREWLDTLVLALEVAAADSCSSWRTLLSDLSSFLYFWSTLTPLVEGWKKTSRQWEETDLQLGSW